MVLVKQGHNDAVLAGSSEAEKIVGVTESYISETRVPSRRNFPNYKKENTSSGKPVNRFELTKVSLINKAVVSDSPGVISRPPQNQEMAGCLPQEMELLEGWWSFSSSVWALLL